MSGPKPIICYLLVLSINFLNITGNSTIKLWIISWKFHSILVKGKWKKMRHKQKYLKYFFPIYFVNAQSYSQINNKLLVYVNGLPHSTQPINIKISNFAFKLKWLEYWSMESERISHLRYQSTKMKNLIEQEGNGIFFLLCLDSIHAKQRKRSTVTLILIPTQDRK